jgi:hypothetical protein
VNAISRKTYEQLIQLLRSPYLSARAVEYVRAELRSRDRTLRAQEAAVFSAGVL